MTISVYAAWWIWTSGNNANGGGYDSTISGAGTNYANQAAAQTSGSAGTASGTTAFLDTVTNGFTNLMIGNCIQIVSGSGFTPGFYFVTGYTSASAVTLDRSPGTGTAAVWNLGGAFADPFTNIGFVLTAPVAGNFVYVRGSGSQRPTGIDYTAPNLLVASRTIGSETQVLHVIGINGRPLISFLNKTSLGFYNEVWNGFVFQAGGAGYYNYAIITGSMAVINCIFDQNGYGVDLLSLAFYGAAINCEFFSSQTYSSGPVVEAVDIRGAILWLCNVHDTTGPGVSCGLFYTNSVIETIVAKCAGIGIQLSTNAAYISQSLASTILNCTIDANTGDAINTGAPYVLEVTSLINNLITNHTGAGTYGINNPSGTAAANDLYQMPVLNNFFYGNTTNTAGFSLNTGPSSGNVVGTNPGYQAQSTEGYNPGSAILNAGYPTGPFIQSLAGQTATQTYITPGAAQIKYVAPVASSGNLLVGFPAP